MHLLPTTRLIASFGCVAAVLLATIATSWPATNLLTNGSFANGLAGWTFSGNVTTSSGLSLTRDSSVQSVLFQTVQHEGLPLNLSLDFYYAVLSDTVPVGTFADAAFFSIYESTNASTLRPDLGQFDSVRSIFDATFNGFTNQAAGVSIQPSSRGPDWWTVLLTNYVPGYDFIAPTLEVYNFNGITNDSTGPMTDVVVSSVPEPGAVVLLCLAAIFVPLARRFRLLAIVCCVLLPTSAPLRAQTPVALGARVRVATGNETSSFDRATRLITQTADVTVTNMDDRPVKAPLRVRVALAGEGDLSRVVLSGVQAGGEGDSRAFYDLSPLLPAGGLAPNASLGFQLRLTRPSAITVSYQLETQGVFNRDPSAAFDAPLAAVAGEEVAFDAGASDDGDGGRQISFAWSFGDGGTSDAAAPKRTFAKPGRYDVLLTVTDSENAKAVLRKTIAVLPSSNFAVARTRTLDAAGQPLGGVAVRQREGSNVTESVSDAGTGFAALGGEPGEYIWSFSREGYLPAWRKASLSARQILFVPSPWLVRENAKDKPVSPLRELVLGGANEPATITFAAGAFAAEGLAGFTPIGPQALPLPLPAGWSPLGAFHLSLPSAPSRPGNLSWAPSDKLGSDDSLAFLEYDAELLQWTVLSLPPPAASPTGAVNKTGTYVLVVADKGARAPPSAQVGVALPSVTDVAFDSSNINATGSVDPSKITASRDALAVTTSGRVVFTGASDLPSGTYFRTEIEETYNLANGRTQRTPVYDTSFFAYQRPGDAETKTLHAAFPLRPTRIISPEQIDTAQIEADILTGDSYAASLFDQTGGRIAAENLAVSAEAGDLSGRSLAELRLLELKSFEIALAGRTGVAAFQLAVGNVVNGRGLDVELSGLAPNKDFVVARHVAKDDEEGLEPVERLRSDAQGLARSVEPAEGARLPGISGPGQYVVVAVDGPQAVVSGVARNLDGEAAAGLAVRISGLPWLTFSISGGAYKLVAPQGATSTVIVTDLADGNSGSEQVAIAVGAVSATANLRAAVTAPRVASVSPADGAQRVRAAAPVQVRFTEAIDPATFGSEAVSLTGEDGLPVQGSLSLNPAGTEATYLPTNPLANAITYNIDLSPGIKDRQGLALAGPRRFSFTVVPTSERAPGAQLVIYEPGAKDIPEDIRAMLVGYSSAAGSSHVVAHGSSGTADPEVPVILVNQNTGETATVLSKPDGSFASFINAAEEDFIEAVFVNANGTRVTVPATKQIYDNGRIGLYRYGGILEASNEEAGKVQVIVEPEAITDRTVFRLEGKSIAQMAVLLNGLVPQKGAVVAGGFTLESEGSELSSPPSVKMTLRPDEFGLPEGASVGPEDFVLAQATEVEGVRVFDVVGLSEKQAQPQNIRSRAPRLVPYEPTNFSLSRGAAGGVIAALAFMNDLFVNKLTFNGSVSCSSLKVPGAFVFAGDVGPSGAALADSSGRPAVPELRGGQVGAVSGPDGSFRFMSSVSRAVFKSMPHVFAVSPKFPSQVAMGPSATSDLSDRPEFSRTANPTFEAPGSSPDERDNLPPKISFSFDPPTPGALGDVSPFTLSISASESGSTRPPSMVLSNVSFTPTNPQDYGQTIAGNLTFQREVDEQVGATRRQEWKMSALIPAKAEFEIVAWDSSQNEARARASVTITPRILADASGPGPMVVSTSPRDATGGALRSEPVVIRFSEPMDPAILAEAKSSMFSVPVADARLDDQNQELIVRLAAPATTSRVTATVSPQLKSTTGALFDAKPTTPEKDAYSFSFDYAVDPPHHRLVLNDGAGVTSDGNGFYYAIDRRPSQDVGSEGDSQLVCFETKADQPLRLIARKPLPPFARDVLYLGRYDYKHPRNGTQSGHLLAVIGGLGGVGQDNWIRIYDVSNPDRPSIVAASAFGLGGNTLGVKLAWSAPRLGILLLGADDISVMELDLQLFIHAQLLSSYKDEPVEGQRGADLNGDGDYVDPSEKIPQPRGKGTIASGLINGGAVETTQLTAGDAAKWRLTDFDLGGAGDLYDGNGSAKRCFGGRWLVACGRSSDPNLMHRFWVLKAPGRTRDFSQSGIGNLALDEEPSRIKLLPGQELFIPGPDGAQKLGSRDLALVSTSGSNTGHVVVIDVSDPAEPATLGKLKIPAAHGKPRSIMVGRDGLLYVACTQNMLVLDPRYLGSFGASPEASFQRAYVHRIDGLGSGNRAFAAIGLDEVAVAFGGKSLLASRVVQPQVIADALRITAIGEKPASSPIYYLRDALLRLSGVVPTQVVERVSQDGKLEAVLPSVLAGVRPPWRMIASANFAPPLASLPRGYPLWRLVKEGRILLDQVGSGSRKLPIEPFEPSWLLNAEYLLPGVDLARLYFQEPALYDVHCAGLTAQVRVYPERSVERKISLNLEDAGPFLATREKIKSGIKQILKRLTALEPEFETKGSFGYKAQWVEKEDSHKAAFKWSVNLALDPAIGFKLKATTSDLNSHPFWVFCNSIGAGVFLESGGALDLVGSASESPDNRISVEGLELVGKGMVSVGAELKGSIIGAEIAAESGLTLKGRVEPNPQNNPPPGVWRKLVFKGPTLSFEGLAVTAELSSISGRWRPAYEGKWTLLESRVLWDRDPPEPFFPASP